MAEALREPDERAERAGAAGRARDAEFVEAKARLLEEARAALAAAGIRAASCDGRDRSLDAEIAYQRKALAAGTSARKVPLYNHVWTGLREGRALEAPGYHRRILDLAAANGLQAETNRRVLAALERAEREKPRPRVLRSSRAARREVRLPSGG